MDPYAGIPPVRQIFISILVSRIENGSACILLQILQLETSDVRPLSRLLRGVGFNSVRLTAMTL